MNKFVKSILTLGITSTLSFTLVHTANGATYKVIDRGDVDSLKYTYAQKENSSGVMAVSGTDVYNFPVQYQYLNEEDFDLIEIYAFNSYLNVHELQNLEDKDAMIQGNPTANDLAWIVRWLQDTQNGKGLDSRYQKIGNTVAMLNFGAGLEIKEIPLWDVPYANSNALTRSTIDIISGITDSGIIYGTGTAPYLPMDPFTDSNDDIVTHFLRDFGQHGFFSYNQGVDVHAVTPLETRYGGGISTILDVSENGVAVGYMSYKINEATEEFINNVDGGCVDPDRLVDIPLEICIQNLQTSMYHSIAFKSQVSANGDVITETLGLLITPHADDKRIHSSYALAINSNGVAVGYADGWDDETVTEPTDAERRNYSYAVVYKNGDVIDFNGDHTDAINSKAYDINDEGIAVGHVLKFVDGRSVQKFFYVDTNVENSEMAFVNPDDFFNGSDSTARAINERGFIVGEGEVETHNESASNPRRTAAFIYDMNNDAFTNVNTLLSCNNIYSIIEARGINDDNIISATAIVKVDRYDAKGEPMLDSNGNPIQEDVVRAVTLQPIDGEIEDCSEVEEKVERQGAGLGFGSLFALFIIGFRRKLKIFSQN